ncbi:MAG: immunoglobulin-like domain-containing protein [Bacilli bacterium]
MNKKGFTLIEILGIIVVLVLIFLITIPLIGNVVGEVRKRVCDLNAKSVEKAADNYIATRGINIIEGVTTNIPLKILRDERFVTKVVDPTDSKTACDGYVIVERIGQKINSKAHIICPTYCNAGEYQKEEGATKNDAYYFDGADPNNWVLFGRYDQSSVHGLLWRIVKTDDGGRKLVFEGLENGETTPLEDGRTSLNGTTGVPYDVLGNNKYKTSTLNESLQKWLDNIQVINKDKYIKDSTWRIGGVPFNDPTSLDTFIELESKDTETEFGIFHGISDLSKVGLLAPSDYMLTSSNPGCVSSYQLGGSFNPCIYTDTDLNNFLYKNKYHYWTMNPSNDTGNKSWYINNIGHISTTLTNSSVISVRPVINIDKNLPFLAGTGTIDDPYILEDYMINIKNAPIITLNGDETIVIREGEPYFEEGATAYDPEDGDITDKIKITSSLNINVPGNYKIEYNVQDSDGNSAPVVIRNVTVSKKEDPVIKLNGSNPLILTLKHDYIEAGAIAIDPYYGDISEDIVIKGVVNTNELGVYEITYNVENLDGKKAVQVTRKIIVEPPRPVITLNGDNPTVLYVGGSYEELGATALDEIDGDLTSLITKKIERTETGRKGKTIVHEVVVDKRFRYEITYSVTNSYGVTTTAKRIIYVFPDEGPIIQYVPNGSMIPQQKHDVKINVLENGYEIDNNSLKYLWVSQYWRLPYNSKLEDVIKTRFINEITVSKQGVTGLYKLYAIAKDIHGNTTIKSSAYYKVDNSRPQLWLNGSNPQRVLINSPYIEKGARAEDLYYSGNLTSKIVTSGTVDVTKPGTYVITYTVSDDAGNTTTRKRNVIVYLSKPVISLKGSKTVKVIKGQNYVEPGYIATDEYDGNITSNVTVSGVIDKDTVGTYQKTYEVTNSLGETTTITRNIEVYIPDPIITITGSNPLNHKVLQPYNDLGATANDLIDGDLTSRIQTTTNVNPQIKGKYEVVYTVTNNHGKSTTVKRIVNVYAQKPVVKLNGSSFIKIFASDPYNELGATATDEIDGDITSKIKITGSVNPSKPGTYQLKYEVTNSFNEVSYKMRTVQVVEPQISITLSGSNPYKMEIFDVYEEPGYIAYHEQHGDITDKITVVNGINPVIAGNYKVTYSYKTSYGSVKSVTRNIVVSQQEGPNIIFTPNSGKDYKQTYSVKVDITEKNGELDDLSFKYLWTTTPQKPLEKSFTTLFNNGDSINTPSGKSGPYYLWILAKDIYNNMTIKSSNAYLLDNVVPVIKLNGTSIVSIPVDGQYIELGATVTDIHSGVNSNGIVIESNVVPSLLGTYTVTYNATDKSGLKAKEVKRIVNVVEASLKDAPGDDFVPKYYSEYFIGTDPRNWVEFGNAADNIYDYVPMLWRIVKADEEGIKLVYEGTYNKGNTPIANGKLSDQIFDSTTSNYDNSQIKEYLEQWYENLNEPNKETLTKPINWCIGGVKTPYDVDIFKLEECNLKTTNKSSIGLLNSVDYLLTSSEPCNAFNQTACGISNFLKKSYNYLTINSASDQTGYIFSVESSGALRRTTINQNQGVRPVINLRSDVLIMGGDGTLENPYKLNTRIPILDETPPTITFEYSNITELKKQHEVKVIVTDDISGVDPGSLKYVWTTSTTEPQEIEFVNDFTNGDLIKTPENETGTYYLWVLAKDKKGNQQISMSNNVSLDNEPPVITLNGTNPYIVLLGNIYEEPGVTANDNVDGDLTSEIITTSNVNPSIEGIYEVIYTVSDRLGNSSIKTRKVYVAKQTDFIFEYTGTVQEFIVPYNGNYNIELWGAAGGGLHNGYGAHTSGIIYLEKDTKIIIYVGEKPNHLAGGYNGGGKNFGTVCDEGGSGGGSTDIRIGNRLVDRIMVAAGGGGAGCKRTSIFKGGSGGTLNGIDAKAASTDVRGSGKGAKQVAGGVGGTWITNGSGYNGSFGLGGNGSPMTNVNRNGSGGGGGYYGGGGGASCSGTCSFSGGGGSSYVSGHLGVNSVNETGIHTNQPNHFSNYIFNTTNMINGDSVMPSPTSTGTMTGNNGHGYARITLLLD